MGMKKLNTQKPYYKCSRCSKVYRKKEHNFYSTVVKSKLYYRKQCIKCFLVMNNNRYYRAKENKSWANTGHFDNK